MKRHPEIIDWLIALIVILSILSAGVGLFWRDGGSPYPFTSLRGQTVQIDGRGLYRNDTLFGAGSFRGTDGATLLVAVPLLVVAFVIYRRGSQRGRFLLVASLSWFLYNGASMALGAAYNSLFLAYIILFSASLFAFILVFTSIDLADLTSRFSPGAPRRGLAIFMFIAGLAPLVLWLGDVLGSLAQDKAPELLATNTTMVTYVLDLGVIVPVVFLAGVLVLRRAALGYVLALIMLVLLAVTGLAVVGQTVAQISAGIVFAPGTLIGMVGSWVILALFAIWFAARLLYSFSNQQKVD
jgi:hypothetical protein